MNIPVVINEAILTEIIRESEKQDLSLEETIQLMIMEYFSPLTKHSKRSIKVTKKLLKVGALKEEKSLKPTLEYDGYADGLPVYDSWKCPTCSTVYGYDNKYNYCPNCEQRIDWSEIND